MRKWVGKFKCRWLDQHLWTEVWHEGHRFLLDAKYGDGAADTVVACLRCGRLASLPKDRDELTYPL